MISLEGKTNFFEKRVAEYQKSGVMESLERTASELSKGDAIESTSDSSSEGYRKLNFDIDF